MTLPIFKSTESLYTIIYRDPEAKQRLSKWCQSSRCIQARVDEHKLHIYDHNTLCLFVVNWEHGWDNILVWDTNLKRHIYF